MEMKHFVALCVHGGRNHCLEIPGRVKPSDISAFFKDCVRHHAGRSMRRREIDRFIRTGIRRIADGDIMFEFSWK